MGLKKQYVVEQDNGGADIHVREDSFSIDFPAGTIVLEQDNDLIYVDVNNVDEFVNAVKKVRQRQ